MLLPLSFLLGFAIGWRRAGRRGGDKLDRLQYGAAHGILFAIVALVALIGVQRLGWV